MACLEINRCRCSGRENDLEHPRRWVMRMSRNIPRLGRPDPSVTLENTALAWFSEPYVSLFFPVYPLARSLQQYLLALIRSCRDKSFAHYDVSAWTTNLRSPLSA